MSGQGKSSKCLLFVLLLVGVAVGLAALSWPRPVFGE